MAVKPGSAWWILGTGAMSTHGEEPKFPDAGPVVDLILTPSGTSVAMSWMPPNPLPGVVPPVGYVVKLDDTGETRETTETNYIWDGLQIDTTYCFSVYSKTELGVLSNPVSDCVLTLKAVSVDEAAQVTHIGASTFAISNPTRGIFEYYLSTSNTDFAQASLISDPSSFTVTRKGDGDHTPYYILTAYPGVTDTSIMGKTAFVCTKVTYTPKTERVCDPCTPHCEPGCGGPGSPTCNPPGVDGDSCYSCCWGCGPGDPRVTGQCCCPCNPNCYDRTTPIKDAVPSGFVERHGEWVKIENPMVKGVRLTQEQEPYPFAAGQDWPEAPYYISFPTPEQTYAQTEPIDPDNPTEVERAWVFAYTIFLTFFDEGGNIYKSLDSQNDPENFIFVKGDGVTTFDEQQVFVQGIDGLQKGTYEMSWIAQGADDNLPHTSIEDTFTLIKELNGNVA